MLRVIILSSMFFSASANASAPVKTDTIDHMPRIADVSRFSRQQCTGARPRIEKVNGLKFKVKFICRNELRRFTLKYTLVKKK